MQTFLPYADFSKSAQVLDYKRLGKQRVETFQILRALDPESNGGWRSHPAVRMWDSHEHLLCQYGLEMCREWISRGYKDTMTGRFEEYMKGYEPKTGAPSWLGYSAFHRSHRSNLLRKDPDYYGPLFEPDLVSDLPYVWPPKGQG